MGICRSSIIMSSQFMGSGGNTYPGICRGDFAETLLKEGEDLKDSACNSYDNENTDEGACHQENRTFHPSFFEKETDDARRKDSKASNGKSRKQDQSDIPQRHHFF